MPAYQKIGECLLVDVNEPYSLELYLGLIREVAERCDRDRLQKVLIDFSQSNADPSITDRYVLGSEIARAWGFRIQGAGVARSEIINHVMENVAVNRGANVKAFTTRQEALQWLGITATNEQVGNEAA
jgi:hypothetical protein